MKPPLVSRAQFKAMTKGEPLADFSGWAREVLGPLPNALPAYYLAMRDGQLLVMCDKSKNPDGATGPQVCLATISAETLATLLASKTPVELTP